MWGYAAEPEVGSGRGNLGRSRDPRNAAAARRGDDRMTESGPEVIREVATEADEVPRLEVPGWRERLGLIAGITTRGTPAIPFDLGLTGDRPVGGVLGQWAAFRAAEPGFPLVTLGRQVHAAEVAWHEGGRGWLMLDGVDGHATAAPGVLLTVTVADCAPIYLADPVTGALALLHAGWRGASARILERGVRLLAGRSGTNVTDIVMHCGVGICGDCYEVGSEVFEAFGLQPPRGGKGQFDVRDQIVRQAGELGIGRVSVSAWCSGHDARLFHSHRRSRGRDGRMVAYLGRPAHRSN
jgi:YfiH family protein